MAPLVAGTTRLFMQFWLERLQHLRFLAFIFTAEKEDQEKRLDLSEKNRLKLLKLAKCHVD